MESYLLWSGTIHMTAKCRASEREILKRTLLPLKFSFESKKLWFIRGWLWPPPTCAGLAALPDQGGGVQLLSQSIPRISSPDPDVPDLCLSTPICSPLTVPTESTSHYLVLLYIEVQLVYGIM